MTARQNRLHLARDLLRLELRYFRFCVATQLTINFDLHRFKPITDAFIMRKKYFLWQFCNINVVNAPQF